MTRNFGILKHKSELSSPRVVVTGESDQHAGSRSAVTQYNSGAENKIPLPSGSIASPVTALKSFNLAQALLDGLVVVGGLVALLVLVGGIPLAVGLLLFAEF